MARINVEQKALTDPRFYRLGIELGAVGQNIVKIGRSLDPNGRLVELQKASPFPLNLIGKKRGDVEQSIHKELASFRVYGEWFTINEEVLAVLCARKVVRR